MTVNKKEFFELLQPHLSPVELVKVKTAYTLAKFGHRFQVRKEIENDKKVRYFEHPKRVALILTQELKIFNCDDICVALLHDVFEDTEDITPEVIEFIFGTYVCKGVKYLTNKPKNNYIERLSLAPENIIAVKLSDRIDNMRHINSPLCTDSFIQKKFKETIDSYLPLFSTKLDYKYADLINELSDICYGN